MKIAFLCSGLEPGKDGVGDYSRLLAIELNRLGHSSIVIGISDNHASKKSFEQQEIDAGTVSILRLPSSMAWEQRIFEAREWLEEFDPDWISLQFVPFGFHPKGLSFGLGKKLVAMTQKASWHIMFHELWVGMEEKAPLKNLVWGGLQRRIVLDMIRRLRPKVVNTQTEPYCRVLSRDMISASVLPLFGNVPIDKGDGWTGLLEPLVAEAIGEQTDRNKLYLAGVFGSVHSEWNPEDAVALLLPLIKRFQKQLVILFFGRSNFDQEVGAKLKAVLGSRADVITLGERTGSEISTILGSVDIGLATSPMQAIQKSGTVTAMLEHGLPVLVTRDDWHVRGADTQSLDLSSRILSPEQFASLETLPLRDTSVPMQSGVKFVAGQMLSLLETAFARNLRK